MSTITVYNAKGAEAGTAELPAELFDVAANIPLIHQVVVAQLAAARQGTHSTKTRGDVRGGGKKPYRQKGTGRARQGSTRSPQFAGGGIAHGPHPHGYAQRTPKKMIAAALRGALSDRARDGRVYVIDDLIDGDVPSTKTALAALASVTSTDKVLVVIHRDEDLAWLSLRNVSSVHALAADQLNAYDVLVNDEVVFTAAALDAYVSGPASGKWAKAVATSTEAGVDEADTDEPSNAELAAASVEESAEPSNEDLAATAASASLIAGPTSSPTEFVEPAESVDDPAEPIDPAEVVDPAEPVEALAEPVEADVDVPTEDAVAEALVEDTYTEGPYGAGSYVGEEPPVGFDIKGNEDSKLFHTPDSPYYSRTVAEVWFSSPEAAEVAGFTDQAANDSSDETEESK